MPTLKRRGLLAAGATLPAAMTLGSATKVEAAVKANTGSLPLTIVQPGDARFPTLVRAENNRWVASPDHVVLARNTTEVVEAVGRAVRNQIPFTVRSGGHCYEDFVYNSRTKGVLDLSEMNAIYFDQTKNAFVIEPGATLGEVYETLYRHWGVTLPGGSCPTVGAGGHITGGGYGTLNRSMGLCIDHLYGVEVVVVNPDRTVRAVTATRDSTDAALRDLFWAHTGGGGGNFGVVTKFYLRSNVDSTDPKRLLPSPPSNMLISQIGFSWKGLTETGFTTLLRNFGAWSEANSAPGAAETDIFARLNMVNAANGMNTLSIEVNGDRSDASTMLDRFVDAVVAGSGVTPIPIRRHQLPWLKTTRWTGMYGGDGTERTDFKSTYMRKNFPAAQAATMYRYLSDPTYPNPGSLVQISSYGGATNAVAANATAEPHRSSVMKLMYLVGWYSPTEDAAHVGWLRRFYRDMYADTGGVPVPNDVTDGCFINYCDIDLSSAEWNQSSSRWHDLYYKENYPRLQQAKRQWDPLNVFNHGQSVTLN